MAGNIESSMCLDCMGSGEIVQSETKFSECKQCSGTGQVESFFNEEENEY